MTRGLVGPVLVTGAAGMLGSQCLLDAPAGVEPHGTDLVEPGPDRPGAPPVRHPGVDLTDPGAVRALFGVVRPVGVVHAAAYTAVDRAEEEEELARRVNALGAEVVAGACAHAGVPLVLVSTDFVFDGESERPYREDDAPGPRSAYGRTKLEGERRALAAWPGGVRVVRTQWLYGPRGSHFPGTMMRLARERGELRVVADQVGCPTSTLELAPALWDVLAAGTESCYHAACEGECSWYDLAVATLELAGGFEHVRVHPCTTEEFPRPAPRPAYSALDSSRLAALRGRPLEPWREALRAFLALPLPRT